MMTSLRRSLGSQFCAGLFIVLIALPFTAPFRAWDSGAPFGKPATNELKPCDDFSDTAVLGAGVVSAAPVLAGNFEPVRTADGRARRPSVLRPVLRL